MRMTLILEMMKIVMAVVTALNNDAEKITNQRDNDKE